MYLFSTNMCSKKDRKLMFQASPMDLEFAKDFELDSKEIFNRGRRMKQWISITAVFTRIV